MYEIHGTTARNYCARCRKPYPSDYIFESKAPVLCCDCGGTVRCDVPLNEEALPAAAVNGAVSALAAADLLIIGGTSLTVYPAASFIRYFRGEHLAVINRDPLDLPLRAGKDLEIQGSIGEIFTQVDQLLHNA